MPISAGSIPIGASYSPTGGSATTITSLGASGEGSGKFFIDEGLDLILRKTMLATVKSPVPNSGAPNGYTQARQTIVLHSPKLLANGNYTTNTLRIEVSSDPETTAAELATLFEMGAHVCVDADFADFREDGSVA